MILGKKKIHKKTVPQYVDKDGNLLTPEEYRKAKEEHDKYMEEFELQ